MVLACFIVTGVWLVVLTWTIWYNDDSLAELWRAHWQRKSELHALEKRFEELIRKLEGDRDE